MQRGKMEEAAAEADAEDPFSLSPSTPAAPTAAAAPAARPAASPPAGVSRLEMLQLPDQKLQAPDQKL